MKFTRKSIFTIAVIAVVLGIIATITAVGANQGWFFPDKAQLIEMKHEIFSFDATRDYTSLEEVETDLQKLEVEWHTFDDEMQSSKDATLEKMSTARESYISLQESLRKKQQNFKFVNSAVYPEKSLENSFYSMCDCIEEESVFASRGYDNSKSDKAKAEYELRMAWWLIAQEAIQDYEAGNISLVQAMNRLDVQFENLFVDGDYAYRESVERSEEENKAEQEKAERDKREKEQAYDAARANAK